MRKWLVIFFSFFSFSYEEDFPDIVPSVGDAGGAGDDYIPGAEIGTSSPVCGSGRQRDSPR